MVSKIDMRTGINLGDPCPFKGMNSVRCRWVLEDDSIDMNNWHDYGIEILKCIAEKYKLGIKGC